MKNNLIRKFFPLIFIALCSCYNIFDKTTISKLSGNCRFNPKDQTYKLFEPTYHLFEINGQILSIKTGKTEEPNCSLELAHSKIYRFYHSVDKFIVLAPENQDILKKYWSKYVLDTKKAEKYYLQIIKREGLIFFVGGIGAEEPRNGRGQYEAMLQSATASGIKYYLQLNDGKLTIYEII